MKKESLDANQNIKKSVILIFLIIVVGVGYYLDNRRSLKNENIDSTPLFCVRTTVTEWNSFGHNISDNYRYEDNITFDESGNVFSIEFIGSVQLDEYNLSYNNAKDQTWTPDLVTSKCEQFGMSVKTELNDQLREIKSSCYGNFEVLEMPKTWYDRFGKTREQIKENYIEDGYECN